MQNNLNEEYIDNEMFLLIEKINHLTKSPYSYDFEIIEVLNETLKQYIEIKKLLQDKKK